MKFKTINLIVLLSLVSTLANAKPSDVSAIKICLEKFKNHPFDKENPKFRTINASVKVFGIGGNINETKKTNEMELVLIKPAVSVLSKTTYKLLNPNAWYCISSKVAVLAKTTIKLACASRLALIDEGVTVLGQGDEKSGGVTVLGSSKVERVGCK